MTVAAAPKVERSRRPPLRLIRRHRGLSTRALGLVCSLVVVCALVAVVAGHALLAEGQIGLTRTQAKVTAAEQALPGATLAVARLETPSRIVGQAESGTSLSAPAQVTQVPWTPLNVPLNPPSLAPATPATTGGTSTR